MIAQFGLIAPPDVQSFSAALAVRLQGQLAVCPVPGRRAIRFLPGPLDKPLFILYFPAMAETATPELLPGTVTEQEEKPKSGLEPGYLVICWNDPVNFMDYVTHVFEVV